MSSAMEVEESSSSPAADINIHVAVASNQKPSKPSLIECVQSLVKLEQSLTQSLARTSPLLSLPTPTTISQVHTILALARSYSTRTSAPPGWNPNLPVLHFSTPNPLPHQLRQGTLGAMELHLVKEERVKKRRKVEQDLKEKEEKERVMREDEAKDPKKKELMEHHRVEDEDKHRRLAEQRKKAAVRKMNAEKNKQERKAAVSMNLSDSSSSGSEEDDSSDGE